MADIAFGTDNRLWGIANNSGRAGLYSIPVALNVVGADAAAQTYWNTNYTGANSGGLSVTYNGAANSAIDYNALTFSPGQSGAGSGTLYAATTTSGGPPSTATSSLYTINTTTGAATLIGTSGAGIVSSGDLAFYGWNANSPGTLYAAVTVGNSSKAQLASINLTTGAATVISQVPRAGFTNANGAFDGMANGTTQTGSLCALDSQYVYTVNRTTGVATQLYKYTAGQVTQAVGAAAFGEAIPAPAAFGLFGLGLAGLAVIRRRRVTTAV